jgi:undecaprenyl diphosphate synthase
VRASRNQSRHALRFFDRKLEATRRRSFRFDADAQTVFEKRTENRPQKQHSFSGNRENFRLSEDLQKQIADAMKFTAENTGTILSVALNYGGRAEIVKPRKKPRKV